MKSWIGVLKTANFEKKDRKLVKRFLAKPFTQNFLSIVELLKKYEFHDESFELLNYGVDKFPSYVAAKIMLAKELFEKGLIQDASETIKRIKAPLYDNILAQKILFKIAVLNEHESTAKSILQSMIHRRLLDREMELLGKKLNLGGVPSAKMLLLSHFEKLNINPCISIPSSKKEANELDQHANHPTKNSEVFSFNDRVISDPSLKQFHAIPLTEIFHDKDEPCNFSSTLDSKNLESQTLAEIYKKQGHYEKSLEIYRRLLKISPGSDYLKRMVVELAKKSEAQQRKDLMIDPALAELEEDTKPKVQFYQHLLEKLNHESSP